MQASRVVFPFTNEKIGGSHVSSFTLGTCLQRDHNIEVVVAAPAGSLIEQVARERGFIVWRLPERPSFRHGPIKEALLLPGHHRLLKSQPPGTIVHANDLSALQSWGVAARLRGLPVLYHNRALNRPVMPNLMVTSLAHRIVCISQSVERALPGWLKRRAVLIDNPIEMNLDQDRAGLRSRFDERNPLARGNPLIGFVGNFANRKRPRFFLEAAHSLLMRNPAAVFVIFGREVDDSQAELESHADTLGIRSRVIFAGFKLPVEGNIAILDLLAVTAIDEPLGRTPLEALLLGVPYVATDDAGLGETGRRFGGGLLVPRAAAADEFAQAMAQALNDTAAIGLTQARGRARDALSARRHADNVLNVYDELLQPGHARGNLVPAGQL